jgi:serine/threonine protein kinase
VEGRKNIDLRAAIYSLGCTLYYLLTGHTPYQAENAVTLMMKHVSAPPADIRTLWPECPPMLAAAITRMMQKDPAARYQSYELPGQRIWAVRHGRQRVAVVRGLV